jgi:hypothetical protein
MKFRCNECMDRPYTCEAIDVEAGLQAIANHINAEHQLYEVDPSTVEIQDITIDIRKSKR